MVQGSRIWQALILIDAMSFICSEKKKEAAEDIFPGPQAGHTWLVVNDEIFVAVGCK
jgi:hypothetical protein